MTDCELKCEIVDGTHYHKETDQKIIDRLESSRRTKSRIRLFLGDVATGVAWEEENDVTGHVGRSTGTCKIPLLIHNSRSMGGGGILDHCVVGILSTSGWEYQHPYLDLGHWEDRPSEMTGYDAEVLHNDVVCARFKTRQSALNYSAFMQGERMAK